MAKKSDSPDTETVPPASPEAAPSSPGITVPPEVVAAMGGMPIPAPPAPPALRPVVTRVGTPLASRWRDPGGILAANQPERRAAVAQVDKARALLVALVNEIDGKLYALRLAVEAAGNDAGVCEQEGFDPLAALALLNSVESALKKHLS